MRLIHRKIINCTKRIEKKEYRTILIDLGASGEIVITDSKENIGCSLCRLIRRPEHLIGQALVSPGKLKVNYSLVT
jgi:predicted aspartyl protease